MENNNHGAMISWTSLNDIIRTILLEMPNARKKEEISTNTVENPTEKEILSWCRWYEIMAAKEELNQSFGLDQMHSSKGTKRDTKSDKSKTRSID